MMNLGIPALEPGIGVSRRAAVAGTDDADQIDVPLGNQPVQVHVDEIETHRRAPVAEQARLDVVAGERRAQQGVFLQVDLPDRQVIGRAPVAVHPVAQGRGERAVGRRRHDGRRVLRLDHRGQMGVKGQHDPRPPWVR